MLTLLLNTFWLQISCKKSSTMFWLRSNMHKYIHHTQTCVCATHTHTHLCMHTCPCTHIHVNGQWSCLTSLTSLLIFTKSISSSIFLCYHLHIRSPTRSAWPRKYPAAEHSTFSSALSLSWASHPGWPPLTWPGCVQPGSSVKLFCLSLQTAKWLWCSLFHQ